MAHTQACNLAWFLRRLGRLLGSIGLGVFRSAQKVKILFKIRLKIERITDFFHWMALIVLREIIWPLSGIPYWKNDQICIFILQFDKEKCVACRMQHHISGNISVHQAMFWSFIENNYFDIFWMDLPDIHDPWHGQFPENLAEQNITKWWNSVF